MSLNHRIRSDEKGNALFLILIAVVLFAALSYAITQSNRGGGAPNRETSLVASTALTQYSSAIRTGVTRMLLRNVTTSSLDFDSPSTSACVGTSADDVRVFCPSGGGVSWQEADLNTVEGDGTASEGAWVFSSTSNVEDIGTSADDVIAFLTNVSEPICQRIVDQIYGTGTTIPSLAGIAQADIVPAANESITGANIDGQAFGCVEIDDGFLYYHVLAEN